MYAKEMIHTSVRRVLLGVRKFTPLRGRWYSLVIVIVVTVIMIVIAVISVIVFQ